MLSIIVVVADDGVIGGGGGLLWHISEDLRMFRRVTTGHAVVMGRKTFESLGRPLPGRVNVVVTRNPSWSAPEGVLTASSLGAALDLSGAAEPDREVFVIGGGEIYAQALPLADRLYLTRVHAQYQGDTYFPDWDPDNIPVGWNLTSRERHERGEEFPHPFEFLVYDRKSTEK